jgi:hypothetical protein
MRRTLGQRLIPPARPIAATLGACVALACTGAPDSGPALSVLSDDVEQDGWVDTAHAVAGDGATSFESDRNELSAGPGLPQPWQPFFYERGFDAGPATAVVGGHLISFSRYRGLVSTRVSGPDAPRVEATVPLGGFPVGLFVSEGVATVLVVDPVRHEQTSRVVLVDVRDPARPRALAEQQFAGTLSAARQVGGALHVLTREIVDCASCAQAPATEFTWFAFDLSRSSELPPPRVTPVQGAASFADDRLIVFSPGVYVGGIPAELRLAQLSDPEPALSAPMVLNGAGALSVSGDRLRVHYGAEIETYALDTGTPVLLGRGPLPQAKSGSLGGLLIEGDRAVSMLPPSGQLVVLDLSDPNAPRITAELTLDIAESQVTLAGDRVLAAGGSTLAADAPSDADVIARGPQALVLVDIADPAQPRILDRATLGGFDSVHTGPPELRGGRALFGYYDEFPTWLYGAKPDDGDCGRSIRRLVGFDISSDRLAPAFAFEGLDSDAQVEAVGGEWWVASSVSVSRYLEGSSPAPAPRLELTRSVHRVRALADGVALFGTDFTSNGSTLELAPGSSPLEALQTLDVAAAVGLPRVGCQERRRWDAPALEREGELYALRLHLPATGVASPGAVSLHVLDALASPGQPSPPRALELGPLDAGEDYLGAIQTDRALLVAHGRRDADPLDPSFHSRALFVIDTTDPTESEQMPGYVSGSGYRSSEGLHPDAKLSYDVIDISDPAAPVLASRLDIDPALATGGFLRSLRGVTRDTPWGFHIEEAVAGPAVVSGSIVAGQHSEPTPSGLFRHYLDRFDLADPASPLQLPPIEIPGGVLDFDAQTGELITLEVLRLRAPAGSHACVDRPSIPGEDGCMITRRALNALQVDDEQATRVGRLLLDTGERNVAHLAVSNGSVYYATDTRRVAVSNDTPYYTTASGEVANGPVVPLAPRELTIERVVLRDGRFERLPSFDVVSAFDGVPMAWEHFAASGERVLWGSEGWLYAVDFSGSEPRVERHDLGLRGCTALDLRGDTAYCAQGTAGYREITLGPP